MKLFYSPTSPYVRKVLACAIERDIERQIELVPTNPHVSPPALLAANPLSKVPCLITADGVPLFDSPVICEFLDAIENASPMFPRAGGARWRALRYQAMADGILDAAVARRLEQAKPQEAARDTFMARQQAAVERTLAELEREPPHTVPDIGSLAVACALGYLDFRFAHEPWREPHPTLAAWYEGFKETPGIARTVPRDPA
ncbi:MAG TPA: glutathione S-transferase [Acetobacteraceae bacterium]|nr:glutathione S-transferase [Acetobacteraceae bacterium]